MIAGGIVTLFILLPPILAAAAAFVVLSMLRVRTIGSMVFATLLGWVAIFALPGVVGRDWMLGDAAEQIVQVVICAVVGATAAALAAVIVRWLRRRASR